MITFSHTFCLIQIVPFDPVCMSVHQSVRTGSQIQSRETTTKPYYSMIIVLFFNQQANILLFNEPA